MDFNSKKQIADVDDFNEYASQIFEEYLKTFTKENGLIKDVTEDDYVDDECQFLYTQKGMRLVDRMKDRLVKVGNHHYPNEDIEIETYMYREY
jgi:hypothetical protein